MNHVSVTAVVPTHNRRELVAETIATILDQRDVDLRLVVVDEASSDGTAEWLARLAASDRRVSVIRHDKALGVAAARNAGIDAATTPWVAKHLTVPENIDRILLPGLCAGDLDQVSRRRGVTIERGPKDLLDLPEFFGSAESAKADYGAYDITILAEINHVPRMTLGEILAAARALRASGADIIGQGMIRFIS